MPVNLSTMKVDSIQCDEPLVIETGTTSSVSIGALKLPVSDGDKKTKMTFSETGDSIFTPRASVQIVTTPNATILETTTIVAVQYSGGPVSLTLPEGVEALPTSMHIVDEGGNSSVANPITVGSGSGNASGDVKITRPFASLRLSPNPSGKWFLKETAPVVINPNGSTTVTNGDGTTTTTDTDGTTTTVGTDTSGNTVETEVSPTGAVTETVIQPSGSTSYNVVEPDGTTTVGTTEPNGDYGYVTQNPDGSSFEKEKSGTVTSTVTANVDGSSVQTAQLDSGFGYSLGRDANGNFTGFSFL